METKFRYVIQISVIFSAILIMPTNAKESDTCLDLMRMHAKNACENFVNGLRSKLYEEQFGRLIDDTRDYGNNENHYIVKRSFGAGDYNNNYKFLNGHKYTKNHHKGKKKYFGKNHGNYEAKNRHYFIHHKQYQFPTRVRKDTYPEDGYLLMEREHAKHLIRSDPKYKMMETHYSVSKYFHYQYTRKKRDDIKGYNYCCSADCNKYTECRL